MKKYFLTGMIFTISMSGIHAQKLYQEIRERATALTPQLVEWRRYLHEHPELSNREIKPPNI